MSSAFTAGELAPSRLVEALPLLRTIWPEIDFDRWQSFATFYSGAGTPGLPQLVGLFDAAGGLSGLFACRVDQDLHEGRFLFLPVFIVVDLTNSLRAVEALLAAANDRARQCGCIGLRLQLSNRQRELGARLRQLGLSLMVSDHSMKISPLPRAEHSAIDR